MKLLVAHVERDLRVLEETPPLTFHTRKIAAEIEKRENELNAKKRQLYYLARILQKPSLLTRAAMKFAQHTLKKQTTELVETCSGQNRPQSVVEIYRIVGKLKKGAKYLLKKGYPWHAMHLFHEANEHLKGGKLLAVLHPYHASQLFIEAGKPLQGARTLLNHHKPGTEHAFWAGYLFATAGAFKAGIRAMQKINRPDLVRRLKAIEQLEIPGKTKAK